MNSQSSWDFTLANYDVVWSFMVQLGLLLLFLMIGNILRRKVAFLRKGQVPSALLGGFLLLITNVIFKRFGYNIINNQIMQVVTYHCLAIGFAAMSLKSEKSNHKTNPTQVVEYGALQGGTYMLQAMVGLGITLLLFFITRNGSKVISFIGGLLLPLGFGQGPGNAMSWDINFTNTPAAQFDGNGSFGLSLASIGFVVASVLGVVYINIYKKRGTLHVRKGIPVDEAIFYTGSERQEIPDNESVDKFSLQMGFVVLAYAISFGLFLTLPTASPGDLTSFGHRWLQC